MQSQNSSWKRFRRLFILGGVILVALLVGYLFEKEDLVLTILGAVGVGLLAITLLVTVHELGHFMAAKMFGMRVEKFSIGFPPRIFSVKRGETEYQLGATPLGGYVKISGMIDESLDSDVIDSERGREQGKSGSAPQPWEFRAKPVWQRMIVMLGGIIMNVLLGILLFSVLSGIRGETHLPMAAVNEYGIEVYPSSIGSTLGFQTGDRPVAINGEEIAYYEDFVNLRPLQSEGTYTVERNGERLELDIPPTAINLLADEQITAILFQPDMPAVIYLDTSRASMREQMLGSAAWRGGLRHLDRITRIDSQAIATFSELRDYIQRKTTSEAQITYVRDEQTFETTVDLQREGDSGVYRLGVIAALDDFYEPYRIKEEFGPLEALGKGTQRAFGVVGSQAQGLSRLADREVETSKLLQGPFQIIYTMYRVVVSQGIMGFLFFTALLSMILAFMNILPIPALDGGHLVFLLYEAITRREPSVKVRLIAQQVGMVLVLALMAFVIFNDAFRLITG